LHLHTQVGRSWRGIQSARLTHKPVPSSRAGEGRPAALLGRHNGGPHRPRPHGAPTAHVRHEQCACACACACCVPLRAPSPTAPCLPRPFPHIPAALYHTSFALTCSTAVVQRQFRSAQRALSASLTSTGSTSQRESQDALPDLRPRARRRRPRVTSVTTFLTPCT